MAALPGNIEAAAALLRDIKPKANDLPGYRASFAMQRLSEDER